ncbi:reverse transcriptase domain-containing protein [Tanacetum coccineum]
MKISSFMDAYKCPELAKRYSDKVPKMVYEAMTRLDDFVRSEEAFANTELPKGEMSEGSRRPAGPRGRGNVKGRDAGKDKVINKIRSWPNDRKRNSVERDESWMKAPIVFPPLLIKDASDDPLIIEAVMEGYLVRRVTFEGYPDGFGGLRWGRGKSASAFTVQCYLRKDRFKIPLSGLLDNTLNERKQMIEQDVSQNDNKEKEAPERVDLTEPILVNPAYPDQLVTIGGNLLKQCKSQLRALLKKKPEWQLAALKRFLSRSAEKSLPFFETLKDVTKENKEEYRWTENAERAFQEMKKVIVELSLLTTLVKEETLYVYLAAATEAVSVVLLAERKGIQCPIHYVSRTLNEAERNYAPLEKLALSLLHMSRRLRRYIEAHPIKVITDQPLKHILNKAQASGKLAKYSVEFGAYNIAYELKSAMKGQVLADFLSEAPVGTPTAEFF